MQTSPQTDLQQMIADYMENGFLDNIIDMFRHDSSLYSLVGALIQDERVRVRIGITALVEELKRLDAANVIRAQKDLLPLLAHIDAVVRGDAANLVGIIGDRSSLPFLEKCLSDVHEGVRTIAREAIAQIQTQ
ncbi:MAG: HEAT repeat domain-containing protein [Nitrospirae bacterium]|nr:HEAT repeat domain-containing protein [Nitrospirota bacterium]